MNLEVLLPLFQQLRIPGEDVDVDGYRRKYESQSFPPEPDVEIQLFNIGDTKAAYFTPPENKLNQKILLFIHGGGFILGNITTYSAIVSKMSKTLGIKAVCFEYRRAPEDKWPAAEDDCLKVYEFLLSSEGGSYSSDNIILVGDSAGACLAVRTSINIKKKQLPRPKGVVSICPWFDMTLSGKSLKENYETDFIYFTLTEGKGGFNPRLYIPAEIELNDTRVTPLNDNLDDLPKMLVLVSDKEMLYDDSITFYENSKKFNTPVELDVWKNLPHDWIFFPIAETWATMAKISSFVNGLYQ